jgi:hypothetical protein
MERGISYKTLFLVPFSSLSAIHVVTRHQYPHATSAPSFSTRGPRHHFLLPPPHCRRALNPVDAPSFAYHCPLASHPSAAFPTHHPLGPPLLEARRGPLPPHCLFQLAHLH